VTLGEHAARVVGKRELERAAVLEIEREGRADEPGALLDLAKLDDAFDAVQTRNRHARAR
jgi:hypothetical protein